MKKSSRMISVFLCLAILLVPGMALGSAESEEKQIDSKATVQYPKIKSIKLLTPSVASVPGKATVQVVVSNPSKVEICSITAVYQHDDSQTIYRGVSGNGNGETYWRNETEIRTNIDIELNKYAPKGEYVFHEIYVGTKKDKYNVAYHCVVCSYIEQTKKYDHEYAYHEGDKLVKWMPRNRAYDFVVKKANNADTKPPLVTSIKCLTPKITIPGYVEFQVAMHDVKADYDGSISGLTEDPIQLDLVLYGKNNEWKKWSDAEDRKFTKTNKKGIYKVRYFLSDKNPLGWYGVQYMMTSDKAGNQGHYPRNADKAYFSYDFIYEIYAKKADFEITGYKKKIGWVNEGTKKRPDWRYYLNDDAPKSSPAKGALKIDGKLYYFDKSGKPETGLFRYKEKYYYFLPEGDVARGGLIKVGNSWCKFASDGSLIEKKSENEAGWRFGKSDWFKYGSGWLTGWQKINFEWYYFKSDGYCTFLWERINGSWYYFGLKGNMYTGWIEEGNWRIGTQWYYAKASGQMVTGWQKINSKWYYFQSSGLMQTGWLNSNGWYYLSPSGAMATGWQKVGSSWYYMSSSGLMATGWQKVGSDWYYMNASGAMQTGWLQQGSTWYYLKPSGAMATGEYTVGGKVHKFAASGAWQGTK